MYYQEPETFQHINFHNHELPVNHYDFMTGTTMPHWHNHYEIVRNLRGINQFHVNGTVLETNPGDILFIPSNSLHSLIPGGNSGYDALVIGDPLIDKLRHHMPTPQISIHINDFLLSSYMVLHPNSDIHVQVESSLLAIFSALREENPFQEDIIITEILRIFTQGSRFQWQQKGANDSTLPMLSAQTELVKDVINYLESHYHEKITIKDISNRLSISEQYFSRLFKSHTGKTFVDYLTCFRLEQASTLLLTTSLPITRIPEMTGFCNPNYFSRVYKNHYGFPPSKARKLLKSSS